MKKICILGLCAAMSMGAMAQESLIKDAEKAMKSGKDYTEVASILTAAISDPATSGNADIYYLPGKAAFNQYDKSLGYEQLGQIKPEDAARMPELLLAGFQNYLKALPLDTVIDAKGKEKTKRSKEIVGTLGAHHPDLYNRGLGMYDQGNYQGAYDLWNYYVVLPDNPVIAKNIPNGAPADSTRAEIAFNMALAAFQLDNKPMALDAFKTAERLGYNKKVLYDYAISVASELQDQETINYFAEKAIPLYGNEDSNYLGNIINGYLDKEDFNTALKLIDDAIAAQPTNAHLYDMKGIVLARANRNDESKAAYKKATELDPSNSNALTHYGQMVLIEAGNLYDATPDGPDFGKVFSEQIKPLLLEAVDALEAAYAANNDNTTSLNLLVQAYHLLGDTAKENDTQKRLQY